MNPDYFAVICAWVIGLTIFTFGSLAFLYGW